MPKILCAPLMLVLVAGATPTAPAQDDWPMWRYDAGRTASSPGSLPERLTLEWTKELGRRIQVWDDPLNHDLMPYDKVFEPVIAGGRLFVGFNDSDKVVAYDLASGAPQWTYYTDGPVRLPPVAFEGRLFVASDDGHLHLLDATSGRLVRKIRGGPSAQKVLGNKRVISMWPARGGPVEREGRIYFAAGIWPFMGTFIYAVDARTGSVTWLNDATSAQYVKQPHSAPSFAGVAPQGALVATDRVLIVPGGRSVPAAFDRKTGRFLHFEINAGGKGTGGSLAMATEKEFFVHTRYRGVRSMNLHTGRKGRFTANEPVLDGDHLYTAKGGRIHAYDGSRKRIWEIEADGSGDLIKAGNRLYAAGTGAITAIELPRDGAKAAVVQTLPVKGEVLRLLAGAGRLVAVTLDGQILVFGSGPRRPAVRRRIRIAPPDPRAMAEAKAILDRVGVDEGYALMYGAGDGRLLRALAAASRLHLIAVDPDPRKVDRLRRTLDAAGLYGKRIAVHVGDPAGFKAPAYVANLVLLDGSVAERTMADPRHRAAAFRSVRPFGGVMWVRSAAAAVRSLKPSEPDFGWSRVEELGNATLFLREGKLPGSADWTHQYGDVANTVKSDDRRVKLPLGILWFGGNSNLDVLPRHGHGPSEQVVAGLNVIEGMDCLSARDVYTGRVVWKRTFKNLGNFGVYFTDTYRDTPLSTAYNQRHYPGANARGTNYVATAEIVYVVLGDSCAMLDARTGKTLRTVRIPPKDGQRRLWGYVGVYENVLLAGAGFANFSTKMGSAPRKGKTAPIDDLSASDGLIAFDRHSGKLLWEVPARYSFLHNGIVAGNGRVYCLDKLPPYAEGKLRRRGGGPRDDYRVVALDARGGRILWESARNVFGSWLGYSGEHDVLLQAGARASDRSRQETGKGMIAYRGASGKVVWADLDRSYNGPCILHHDRILTNTRSHGTSSGAFELLTGKEILISNPITGQKVPWKIYRGKGCNTTVASEHLLTFRDGAAGYYDLTGKSGSGSFGGFKSGCTSNLIVANGVLNAPDYTRTCSCGYQNQTSLALIHMPEVEVWSVSQYSGELTAGEIRRLGLNFGAPGDRLSPTGTLWLDHPAVGGASPDLSVEVKGGDLRYVRHHAGTLTGAELPWVAASALVGAESIKIGLRVSETGAAGGKGIAIGHDDDDAEEGADGEVDLDSSDLEMILDKKDEQVVGLRFNGIPHGKAARIKAAYLQFTVDDETDVRTRLSIHAEASDNAGRFSSGDRNVSSRPRTRSSVQWTPGEWKRKGEAGTDQRTPDLTALVREVLSRPGWKAGNSIVFLIRGQGERTAVSHDGEKKEAARLVIETEGKGPAVKPEPKRAGRPYTVRLHFAEPEGLAAGKRVFSVSLQGKRVIEDLDVTRECGPDRAGLVREFKSVWIAGELELSFHAKTGLPVLNGLELISE